MKRKLSKVISVALAGTLLLAGCSGQKSTGSDSGATNELPIIAENNDPAIEGGVLKVGLVTDSPFKGVFSSVLYEGNDDAAIMQPTMWGTFMGDEDFKIRNGGPVEFIPNEKDKTVTLKISEKYKWSDGTPVTANDFLYAYKIIGHKDYTGVRYDSDYQNVVGIKDYHEGKSKEISGIETPDAQTVIIHFEKFGPNILWGAGVPYEPVSYNQLKDIPVKDLESADAIRKNPLSPGPYQIVNIVPGEKIQFKANEFFWNGKPKIPEVIMEVVSSDTIAEALKAGKYDLVTTMASSRYNEVKELTNCTVLGRDELGYSYMGFKLGKFDEAKGEVITDPNAKMSDVNLRKAMGYALDNNAIGEKFYFGLRRNATSLIPPVFKNFHHENENAISFDMDKAKKLLDDGGYKDVDNDGLRENPKGEKLKINLATMAGGGDLADTLAQYYLQQWKEIGLDVQLTTGRPIEFNAFYDKVQADDPEIDVWVAAWGTGTNPEPSGFYGRKAAYNFSRFASPELDQILADISSDKALDDNFRNEAYKKFEDYMVENVPVIPLNFRKEITVVNKRVKNFDWSYSTKDTKFSSWGDLELTAAEPIK
ncbi:MAG: ABC transporter substrate-binding protein [Filifactoraceae bacterium]